MVSFTSPLGFLLVEKLLALLKGILSGFLIWLLHVPLKDAYLGIAISNLKSTHKDHPRQLLKTSNSTKHFLAGSFGGFLTLQVL